MAEYTVSILDILQENADGVPIDPTSPDMLADIEVIARKAIFSNNADAIDEKYRSSFIRGFCLNFLLDEIGVETLSMWRILLAGKLLNNASYINQVYDTLGKEIFSQYSTRRVNREGVETTKGTDTEQGQNTQSETGSANTKDTGTGTVADLGDVRTTDNTHDSGTSTVSDKTGGSDTTSRTGTESVDSDRSETLSGTDSMRKTGTESTNHTGSTTTSYGKKDQRSGAQTDTYNSLKVANTGTVNESGSEQLTFPGGRGTKTDESNINKFSNTPQQGLSGVLEGNYLTTAAVDDNSSTVSQTGSEKTGRNNTRTDNTNSTTTGSVTHADGTATTSSGSDKVSENSTDSTSHNTTDSTTYGRKTTSSGGDTTTHNTNDRTTYGRTGTTTTNDSRDSTGTGNTHTDSTQTSTRNYASDTDTTREAVGEDTRTRNSDGSRNSNEDVLEESYQLNYEMLTSAQPLLNKVWALFDDLFLQIL